MHDDLFEDYDHCESATLALAAYLEGYVAYLNGASNLYSEYPYLSKAWQEGFEHAQKDELNNEPIF